MPKIKANGITINYEQQGAGEPLVLIPYLVSVAKAQIVRWNRDFRLFLLQGLLAR